MIQDTGERRLQARRQGTGGIHFLRLKIGLHAHAEA